MNYYQRPFDLRHIFRGRSIIIQLILINVFVWITINLIKLLFFLFKIPDDNIIIYLGVPASLSALLERPWTIISYMFTHEGFLHIFFNMFLLYVGGRIFTDYLSEKKLLNVYILGGLFGAAFYILSYNIFPVFNNDIGRSIAIGASASVLAVFIAIASYVPDYSIYLLFVGKIKLKYIAFAFILIDLLSIPKDNPGGHLAHLGGALWGFIYIWQLKKGRDFSFKIPKINVKKKSKIKVEFKREGRPLTDEQYNELRADKQKKIDDILDKIAKKGYDSLTKEEKEFLFNSSK